MGPRQGLLKALVDFEGEKSHLPLVGRLVFKKTITKEPFAGDAFRFRGSHHGKGGGILAMAPKVTVSSG